MRAAVLRRLAAVERRQEPGPGMTTGDDGSGEDLAIDQPTSLVLGNGTLN